MWQWIAIGFASFLALSASTAFALARILGLIGRNISELYEAEQWMTLPITRAQGDTGRQQRADVHANSPSLP
jgi:uncharacterized protein YvpB